MAVVLVFLSSDPRTSKSFDQRLRFRGSWLVMACGLDMSNLPRNFEHVQSTICSQSSILKPSSHAYPEQARADGAKPSPWRYRTCPSDFISSLIYPEIAHSASVRTFERSYNVLGSSLHKMAHGEALRQMKEAGCRMVLACLILS